MLPISTQPVCGELKFANPFLRLRSKTFCLDLKSIALLIRLFEDCCTRLRKAKTKNAEKVQITLFVEENCDGWLAGLTDRLQLSIVTWFEEQRMDRMEVVSFFFYFACLTRILLGTVVD